MTELERFIACMEYKPADRRPNHELGAWPQTMVRWQQEAPEAVANFTWNWFVSDPALQIDRREYIGIDYGLIPCFEHEVLEDTPDYVISRNYQGIVTKALKEGSIGGARMCMDQYIDFPVREPADFADIKRRMNARLADRYPRDLDAQIERWKKRDYPLTLGYNCAARGFYWRARELMGTEALSFAWYDYPKLMHEMMETIADFLIEVSRPVLEKIDVECFAFNEDLSMKGGPLLGPDTYREFIFPHMKRVVEFLRSHGTRYVSVDSDGDPTPLIPLFMEAGVDTMWPIERASEVSPMQWRKKFGKALRLTGGVDKRVLAVGPAAIRKHLLEMVPLIEEGGFIPTVDHTVPPDVSWDNFRTYMDLKRELLAGTLR